MIVTMKVIEAICDRYKEGLSQKQVANNVGVSLSTVNRILQERGLSRSRGYRQNDAAGDGSVQLAMKKEIMRVASGRNPHVFRRCRLQVYRVRPDTFD